MAENNHNDQILNMLALNEEINSLNNKVKQLVEDLHNTQTVLGGIQDLTSTLTTKVSQFTSTIGTYKPRVEEPEEKSSKPSYDDGVNERIRIVPTPENYQEYAVNAQKSVPIPEASVPGGVPNVMSIEADGSPVKEAPVPTKMTKSKDSAPSTRSRKDLNIPVKPKEDRKRTHNRKTRKSNRGPSERPEKNQRLDTSKKDSKRKEDSENNKPKKRGFFGGKR